MVKLLSHWYLPDRGSTTAPSLFCGVTYVSVVTSGLDTRNDAQDNLKTCVPIKSLRKGTFYSTSRSTMVQIRPTLFGLPRLLESVSNLSVTFGGSIYIMLSERKDDEYEFLKEWHKLRSNSLKGDN